MERAHPPQEISDTPNYRSPRTGAFTLLEILLVLGLIGFLAGVLVLGSVRMMSGHSPTPEETFWKAVNETRRLALVSGKEVRLQFKAGKGEKDKERALVAMGPEGGATFPFDKVGELTFDFLSATKGKSAILIRGQLVQTQTLPFVTFYGDGTCSPFTAQIRTGGAARTLGVDPWTCAPVLTAAETSR